MKVAMAPRRRVMFMGIVRADLQAGPPLDYNAGSRFQRSTNEMAAIRKT
jgi:hypothetical protein